MVIAWSPGAERDVPEWMAFRTRCAEAMRHEPIGRPDGPSTDLARVTDDKSVVDGDTLTGDEMRRMRLNAGLSLIALAKRTNYSKGYLSKIETGLKPVSLKMSRHIRRILAE